MKKTKTIAVTVKPVRFERKTATVRVDGEAATRSVPVVAPVGCRTPGKKFVTVAAIERRIRYYLEQHDAGKQLFKGTMEPIMVRANASPYFITDEDGNFEQFMSLREIAEKFEVIEKWEVIAPKWVKSPAMAR